MEQNGGQNCGRNGVRASCGGLVVLALDHAPDGETSPPFDRCAAGMSLIMSMTQVLGTSPLALRAAETMRCGEYLRSRGDTTTLFSSNSIARDCSSSHSSWTHCRSNSLQPPCVSARTIGLSGFKSLHAFQRLAFTDCSSRVEISLTRFATSRRTSRSLMKAPSLNPNVYADSGGMIA